MEAKKICVIGMGYIGLPTAAILSSHGYKVTGVDLSQEIVDSINSGSSHIDENGIHELVSRGVSDGNLTAQLKPVESDVYIICVPTPFKEDINNFSPDMRMVESALDGISPLLKKGDLIILESTSPVGTTKEIARRVKNNRDDLKIDIEKTKDNEINFSYCPERVLPGNILSELIHNSRIFGGLSEACAIKAKKIYEPIVKGELICTDCDTAELAKLTENSFRDNQIAFANELSIICDKAGIDIWKLIKLSNMHPRVNILNPGPGVGGHCIAVDPWFIVSSFPDEAQLIRKARERNDYKKIWCIKKIYQFISSWSKKHKKPIEKIDICFLGLTYKPNVSDLRESPAMDIATEFSMNFKGNTFAVEPKADPRDIKNINLLTLNDAQTKSDIIILLVKHNEFDEISVNHDNFMDFDGIWSGKGK